jgi:uncharacterized membrane protein
MQNAERSMQKANGARRLVAALPLGLLAGVLLFAAALALLFGGVREAAAFEPRPDLVDFFPPERNAGGEYRFAYPSAGLLWGQPMPEGARLTLRVQSPAPLPGRELLIEGRGGELLRAGVGEEPRTLRVLLPPGDPAVAGYALRLRSEAARAPGDERSLGLLFTTVRLDAEPPAPPLGQGLLAAALLAAAAGAALSLGLGWAVAGATAAGLALVFRADPGRLWVLGGAITAALVAVRLALPRPLMDWAERRRPLSAPAWAAFGAGAAFTALAGWYAVRNHGLYGTSGYDLGLYDQTFWLISRFLPSYSTGAGIDMVGSHAALVLYPIAALYWPLPDARTALLLQTAAVGLACVPLYLLGRDRGHPWLGVAAGVAYLAHPATQNMVLFDFHVDTIAATALLFALWAAEARRWRLFVACCAVVILCKENFAVTTAWLGLGLIVLRRQWRAGAILVVASAAWFLFSTQVLVPAIIGKGESLHVSRFARYGDSIPAILRFALANPLAVLGDLLAPGWAGYVLALLIPFAFLPLLSPYALLALPALAINLLSAFEGQRSLFYHYNSLIVAALAAGAVDGACRVCRGVEEWRSWGATAPDNSRRRSAAAAVMVALLLGAAWLGQGVAELRREAIDWAAVRDAGLTRQRDYVRSLVPTGAGVSAQGHFQPHLTHRAQAFIFPNPFIAADFYNPGAMPFAPQVEYVLVDTRRIARGSVPAEEQLALLDDLEARGLYRRAADVGGIVLLERVPGAPDACYGPGWRGEECRL